MCPRAGPRRERWTRDPRARRRDGEGGDGRERSLPGGTALRRGDSECGDARRRHRSATGFGDLDPARHRFGRSGRDGVDVVGPGLGRRSEAVEGGACGGRERAGRRVPLRRLLRERLQDDVVELRRDRRRQGGRARRRVVEVAQHDRHALAHERRAPDERLEQHATEGVDVESLVERLGAELLGRHVGRGPEGGAGRGQTRLVGGLADVDDPEVGEVDEVAGGQQDVRRLDVAVDDAGPVRRVERVGDLLDDADGPFRWQRAVGGEQGSQVAAPDQAHVDEHALLDHAEVVDRDDVRGVETGGDPGLAAEALADVGIVLVVGQEPLERDRALAHGVEGLVDLAHPAAPEPRPHAVRTELLRHQRLTPRFPRTAEKHRRRLGRRAWTRRDPTSVGIAARPRVSGELGVR